MDVNAILNNTASNLNINSSWVSVDNDLLVDGQIKVKDIRDGFMRNDKLINSLQKINFGSELSFNFKTKMDDLALNKVKIRFKGNITKQDKPAN